MVCIHDWANNSKLVIWDSIKSLAEKVGLTESSAEADLLLGHFADTERESIILGRGLKDHGFPEKQVVVFLTSRAGFLDIPEYQNRIGRFHGKSVAFLFAKNMKAFELESVRKGVVHLDFEKARRIIEQNSDLWLNWGDSVFVIPVLDLIRSLAVLCQAYLVVSRNQYVGSIEDRKYLGDTLGRMGWQEQFGEMLQLSANQGPKTVQSWSWWWTALGLRPEEGADLPKVFFEKDEQSEVPGVIREIEDESEQWSLYIDIVKELAKLGKEEVPQNLKKLLKEIWGKAPVNPIPVARAYDDLMMLLGGTFNG
jgi:hypothetical protein